MTSCEMCGCTDERACVNEEAGEDLLHRIYADGGRLRLEGGRIKPSRDSGSWTEDEKAAIKARRKEIAALLEDDDRRMSELFGAAFREALMGAPAECDFTGLIRTHLDAAQDAYEAGDIGLTRYHLRLFVDGCKVRREQFEREWSEGQAELVHVESAPAHRDEG